MSDLRTKNLFLQSWVLQPLYSKRNDMQRRDFLRRGLGGTMAFALSGLIVGEKSAEAAGTVVSYDFTAVGSVKTLIDGANVFMWEFKDNSGVSGPGALGSGIVIKEGDQVEVTVTNTLDRDINFVIPGAMENTPAVAPGATRTYSFLAPAAGSYRYTDDANGFLSQAMGLFGPLVVTPADGSNAFYPGGDNFVKQYTLVMSDLDDRLNAAVEQGGTYDINDYEPNYFFINGLIYPDTTLSADTLITMDLGTDIGIRFISASAIEYPMHYHGYHANVTTRNRKVVTDVISKDTILVNPGETVDTILPVIQAGIFPLHTHYVPAVAANGVYSNPYGGGLLLMIAT